MRLRSARCLHNATKNRRASPKPSTRDTPSPAPAGEGWGEGGQSRRSDHTQRTTDSLHLSRRLRMIVA